MADSPPTLSIEFEETGRVWTQIESFTIDDDFTVEADAWSAVVKHNDPKELRRIFLPLSRVRLYLGDKLQLVGRIKKTQGVRGSTSLRIEGYDYFADLVAPGVDPSVSIVNTMTLRDALLEGLRPHGITEIETSLDEVVSRKMGNATIEVEDDRLARGLERFFPAYGQRVATLIPESTFKQVPVVEEVSAAQPQGQAGLLDWAQGLCSRFHATLQPGSKRSAVAVVAPDYSKKAVFEFRRPDGNVQDAFALRDWEQPPSVSEFRAKFVDEQMRTRDAWHQISLVDTPLGQLDEVKRILANARAVPGRLKRTEKGDADSWYCPIYFKDTKSRKFSELESATQQSLSEKTQNTLVYQCDLRSFFDESSGLIFTTNVLANVIDDIEDVEETLWIKKRSLGHHGGDFATLTLIRPASYIL